MGHGSRLCGLLESPMHLLISEAHGGKMALEPGPAGTWFAIVSLPGTFDHPGAYAWRSPAPLDTYTEAFRAGLKHYAHACPPGFHPVLSHLLGFDLWLKHLATYRDAR